MCILLHVGVTLTTFGSLQEAAKPKEMKRDEWMLVPPENADFVNSKWKPLCPAFQLTKLGSFHSY